ncbi:MAG: type I-E CRISPR-associated endoribonuclease Cas2e [Bacillota bacterium]
MIVLIVESVPPSLRGQLSKWLLEPQAGVFVGNVSAAVRELLWETACQQAAAGNCTLIHSAANEQGYSIRTCGDTKRVIEDWEGLFLVRRPKAAEEENPARTMEHPISDDKECDDAFDPIAEITEARSPELERNHENLHFLLWGKTTPYKSLLAHMIDVGVVAQSLLTNGCMAPIALTLMDLFQASEEQVLSLVGFIAALHDQGKCHPLFQGMGKGLRITETLKSLGWLQDDIRMKFRHEKYSERIFRRLAKGSRLSRHAARMIAATLRLHHQGKLGEGDEPEERIRSAWHAMQENLMNSVREVFPAELSIVSKCRHFDCAGVIISAIIILADWLASGNERFLRLGEARNLQAYTNRARIVALEVVAACGLGRSKALPVTGAFCDLWKEIPAAGVRPLQLACVEACRAYPGSGLVIVEAPMGEGKTEAAVYIAAHLMKTYCKEGMYIALPTAATSNQMHGRISDPAAAAMPWRECACCTAWLGRSTKRQRLTPALLLAPRMALRQHAGWPRYGEVCWPHTRLAQ